ncbi:propionyl-CoA carboxylase [Kyrpidia spormannii]|uniref:Propionyl-CoA carboxylase n=1 Tax=Kyrpidia spormannii TaxID=2055160 RepID=A0A2K8N683_9BACL|nr:acyl-CoA carboxylase subunit beta [Kyrpidia spormannii]ATY84836.1 propionyl-CoA carboxylase [Kyrpidia spormannii]
MGEREQRVIRERRRIQRGGPPRGHQKQAEAGKKFVRDRLALFFDDGGPYTEFGQFARWPDEELPGDGVVTGTGRIDGRTVFFAANDFTVKAGSIGRYHGEKLVRAQEAALRARKPMLYLVDSSGARIDETGGHHVDKGSAGKLFYMHSIMSGSVPQVGVLYGTCFAGTAYTPVFTDLLVMMSDSAMAIASPRMVEMAIGQKVGPRELGGAQVHLKNGSAHFVVDSEEEAGVLVRRIFSYLPDSSENSPPPGEFREPALDPADIDEIIPADPNRPYDVHRLIDAVVDQDSFLEVKAGYADELVTGFARLGGRVIGVVANQPAVKGGTLFPESSDKGAEFVWMCDAYNIPLLFLVDTPGFMVGTAVEKNAILRRGRKFIFATSCATVPRICVVVRKAYGAGIYAMSGPAYDPELTLALPSAEIAVMGPEAAINAVYFNKLQAVEDPVERERLVARLREEYRAGYDIFKLAGQMVVDELIPPRELRNELLRYFEIYTDKKISLPPRKHATIL